MDENSVSFQMFLILLSSITLGSESQISVLTMSEQYLEVCFVLFWFFFFFFFFFVPGKHAQKHSSISRVFH